MGKHLTYLLLLWVIFCAGCTRHQDYPEAIQRAKSCMDEHPDSALQLLTAYADSISTQPEETRMYYHLLTHQAKDKLYMKPESDSLINRIVAFYDETDDKDKQMLAYYYQGSVYRDLNDAPRALKAFQQVLHLGEGYPPCDLFARTYNQMGTLFAYQGLYDESLEANKKAAEQFILPTSLKPILQKVNYLLTAFVFPFHTNFLISQKKIIWIANSYLYSPIK